MALSDDLVLALKRLLKLQGMTYAQLAARLDLSEAAVKRMFSTNAIKLDRLEQICAVLNVGLSDLVEVVQHEEEPLASLSETQEEELVADPRLLLAMYLAINRWTETEVLDQYTFTKPEWTLLLAKLDRMKILILLPGNRSRLCTARNFEWRPNGPVEAFFKKRMLPDFFMRPFEGENNYLRMLTGMLAPHSLDWLDKRLIEFTREFDSLLIQDSVMPVAKRRGVSIVIGIRPWENSLFDSYRRK